MPLKLKERNISSKHNRLQLSGQSGTWDTTTSGFQVRRPNRSATLPPCLFWFIPVYISMMTRISLVVYRSRTIFTVHLSLLPTSYKVNSNDSRILSVFGSWKRTPSSSLMFDSKQFSDCRHISLPICFLSRSHFRNSVWLQAAPIFTCWAFERIFLPNNNLAGFISLSFCNKCVRFISLQRRLSVSYSAWLSICSNSTFLSLSVGLWTQWSWPFAFDIIFVEVDSKLLRHKCTVCDTNVLFLALFLFTIKFLSKIRNRVSYLRILHFDRARLGLDKFTCVLDWKHAKTEIQNWNTETKM